VVSYPAKRRLATVATSSEGSQAVTLLRLHQFGHDVSGRSGPSALDEHLCVLRDSDRRGLDGRDRFRGEEPKCETHACGPLLEPWDVLGRYPQQVAEGRDGDRLRELLGEITLSAGNEVVEKISDLGTDRSPKRFDSAW
jgi:hypothetical protein